MIKILSWNIRQGGGSRLTKLMQAVQTIDAQIVVLSEFRNNATGAKLRMMALQQGYRYQIVSAAPSANNSVFILSKFPCDVELFSKSDPIYFHNIIKVEFDAFSVYGMYLPHKKKHVLFDLIHERAKSDDKPMVFCGDFNCGINYLDQKGNSFWYEDELKLLGELNCVDAFRALHGEAKVYSWFSHQGNGYRYDHTWVHKDLIPIVQSCEYLHQYREVGLSDHSPMILSLGV